MPDAPPAARILTNLAEKAMDHAIEDPLAAAANLDGAMGLIVKLLPTLPGEFPIPIPRGIYEKLQQQQKGG